ncbi:MAG: hypothetical protein QOF77_975 [Solirubrobacteraceae bacterium]|nr:hypothetical protein [Solirubrobacteraceae bacterium]
MWRGAALDVEGSTISGGVRVSAGAGMRVCASRTRGSISVGGARGFVLIGDSGDDGCLPNTVGGSLRLAGNTHGLEVIGNAVRGGLRASRNSGRGAFPSDRAPEVSGNRRLRTSR